MFICWNIYEGFKVTLQLFNISYIVHVLACVWWQDFLLICESTFKSALLCNIYHLSSSTDLESPVRSVGELFKIHVD